MNKCVRQLQLKNGVSRIGLFRAHEKESVRTVPISVCEEKIVYPQKKHRFFLSF
jgi:hypothetical protein